MDDVERRVKRLRELGDLAAALQTATSRLANDLNQWVQDDAEQASEVVSRIGPRIDYIRRFRRAIDDVIMLAGAKDIEDALRRTDHLAFERIRPSPGHGSTVLDRGQTRALGADAALGVTRLSIPDGTDPEHTARVTDAVAQWLELAGYEVVIEGIDEWGSWAKSLVTRIRRSDAPKRLAEGAIAAANDTYVRVPGAAATKDLSEAASNALNAIGDSEGVMLFDNLTVMKVYSPATGKLTPVVYELTATQRHELDRQPSLALTPQKVLEVLDRGSPGEAVSERSSIMVIEPGQTKPIEGRELPPPETLSD